MPLEQFASQLGLSELQLALGVIGVLSLIWVIVYNIRHARSKKQNIEVRIKHLLLRRILIPELIASLHCVLISQSLVLKY
jgi:hypothetical protein